MAILVIGMYLTDKKEAELLDAIDFVEKFVLVMVNNKHLLYN
jgi:hypothetical protein